MSSSPASGTHRQRFDVLIRGGGIVGQTLALLLARDRLKVALLGQPRPAGAGPKLREYIVSSSNAQERADFVALFREDPAAWLALTAWTYRVKETGPDGRERPALVRDVPFIPWPVQVSAIRRLGGCVKDGRDVVIRKSRDMGASWLVVGLAAWGWLFHGWQSLLVSRVEDNVDRTGDPDSLFWKVDYIISSQPSVSDKLWPVRALNARTVLAIERSPCGLS